MHHYTLSNLKQDIVYADTHSSIDDVASSIRGPLIVGFDCEMLDSRVYYHGTTRRKGVYLVTLATDTTVYLFHLYTCDETPHELKRVLASESIVKVGFATHNDVRALQTSFPTPVHIASLIDLKAICVFQQLPHRSLRDIANAYTTHRLDKGKAYDWTTSLVRPRLREEEIRYAALDAVVCLEASQLLLPAPVTSVSAKIECDRHSSLVYAESNEEGKRPPPMEEVIAA